MRFLRLVLLFAAVARSASIQERAVSPGGKGNPPPRDPSISEDTPSSVDSGGGRPHDIDNSPDAGGPGGAGAAAGHGTAPESTNPFNEKSKELNEKAVEAASEVFDMLDEIVSLASGDDNPIDDDDAIEDDDDDDADDGKWQSSSVLPQAVKPTQVASTSDGAANATANFIVSRNNVTYAYFSDPGLLSKDVVIMMANYGNSLSNDLSFYESFFTSEEYSMFLKDPICFYANVESMYRNASSVVDSDTASMTPTPTQALERRQTSDNDNTSCVDDCFVGGLDGNDDDHVGGLVGNDRISTADAGSPEWTSSQSALWASVLPDQLWSAHFAPPTAAYGEVTAMATSTTSCAGLDGGDGPVARYRQLKIRGEDPNGDDEAAFTPKNQQQQLVGAGRRVDGGRVFVCLGPALALLGSAII